MWQKSSHFYRNPHNWEFCIRAKKVESEIHCFDQTKAVWFESDFCVSNKRQKTFFGPWTLGVISHSYNRWYCFNIISNNINLNLPLNFKITLHTYEPTFVQPFFFTFYPVLIQKANKIALPFCHLQHFSCKDQSAALCLKCLKMRVMWKGLLNHS